MLNVSADLCQFHQLYCIHSSYFDMHWTYCRKNIECITCTMCRSQTWICQPGSRVGSSVQQHDVTSLCMKFHCQIKNWVVNWQIGSSSFALQFQSSIQRSSAISAAGHSAPGSGNRSWCHRWGRKRPRMTNGKDDYDTTTTDLRMTTYDQSMFVLEGLPTANCNTSTNILK